MSTLRTCFCFQITSSNLHWTLTTSRQILSKTLYKWTFRKRFQKDSSRTLSSQHWNISNRDLFCGPKDSCEILKFGCEILKFWTVLRKISHKFVKLCKTCSIKNCISWLSWNLKATFTFWLANRKFCCDKGLYSEKVYISTATFWSTFCQDKHNDWNT